MSRASGVVWDRAAAVLLAVWLAGVLWTSLAWHPTPLYSVESDTIGEYIPAARSLGLASLLAGDVVSATREFERVLAADPGHAAARLQLGRAWRLRGERTRALAVLEGARPSTAPEAGEMRALADSIRAPFNRKR